MKTGFLKRSAYTTHQKDKELKLAISVWQQDLYLRWVLLHRTEKYFVIRLYMEFNKLNEFEIFFECFLIPKKK